MASLLPPDEEPGRTTGLKLAPFNPSSASVIAASLELLALQAGDVLFDLGCGDGRVMIEACRAQPGLRAVGIEYDQVFATRARDAVTAAGLADRVQVQHANVLDVDYSSATAVFVYLVPKGMQLVKPKLLELLAQGRRVVSYVFSVPGLQPAAVRDYKGTKVNYYDSSCIAAANAEPNRPEAALGVPASASDVTADGAATVSKVGGGSVVSEG